MAHLAQGIRRDVEPSPASCPKVLGASHRWRPRRGHGRGGVPMASDGCSLSDWSPTARPCSICPTLGWLGVVVPGWGLVVLLAGGADPGGGSVGVADQGPGSVFGAVVASA